MTILKMIIDTFGSVIIVPCVVFLLSVAIRVKPKEAFMGAFYMGIGLTAFNIILSALMTAVSPSITMMVENTGLNLPGLDIGWGAGAAIVFANSIGMFYLVFGIIINLFLFLVKWTDTFQPTDIWNYYHFLFWAACVQFVTGSFALAVACAVFLNLIVLLLADWLAPALQEYYGYEGVTSTCLFSTNILPFAVLMRWIFKKLRLDNIKLDPKALQKSLGIFGQPVIIGAIIGITLALIANIHDLGSMTIWAKILTTGITVGTIMALYPSVSGLFVKGLLPISNTMNERIEKGEIKRKNFNLSLDPAIYFGEEANLTSGLLLMPIMLLIAVIQPGNRMLPLADLAAIPFGIIAATVAMRGNIFGVVVTSSIWYGIGQWFNSSILEMFTQAAANAGVVVEKGALISSWCIGVNPIGYLGYKAFILDGSGKFIGIGILVALYLIAYYFYKKNKVAWWVAAGASPEFIKAKLEAEAE
ncbi:MAG: PTS transporter subunit IIC [Peptococcia bacterium]|jgi:PTS system galactitol-specific IIC component